MINPRITKNKPKLFPEPLQGKVTQEISSKNPGRIQFQGSYYPAKLYQNNSRIILKEYELVKVIGREGITLLITPY